MPRISGFRLEPMGGSGVGRPGGFRNTGLVSAICLNYERLTPEPGDNFKHILDPRARGTIKVGEKTYPLSESLEKGWISISGTGDHTKLEIKNNTKEGAEINIKDPIPLSVTKSDDLADLSDHGELFKGFTEALDPTQQVQLQGRVWDLTGARREERLRGLLDEKISPEDYRKKHTGDGFLELLGEAGRDKTAIFRRQNDYTLIKKNKGSIEEESFTIDRDEDGALTKETAAAIRALQPKEFTRAADASTPSTSFLAFGVASEVESKTTCQLGKKAVDVSSEDLLNFYEDVHAALPDGLRQLVEHSGA